MISNMAFRYLSKLLLVNIQYAFKVQEMLDESPIWKQYKDQKMDLFLADKPRFAIEASPGQTNLYLTQVKYIYNIFA